MKILKKNNVCSKILQWHFNFYFRDLDKIWTFAHCSCCEGGDYALSQTTQVAVQSFFFFEDSCNKIGIFFWKEKHGREQRARKWRTLNIEKEKYIDRDRCLSDSQHPLLPSISLINFFLFHSLNFAVNNFHCSLNQCFKMGSRLLSSENSFIDNAKTNN